MKIRSYEEACEKFSISPDLVVNFAKMPSALQKPLIAFYKLALITLATNDWWLPNYNDPEEKKFYIHFDIVASKERPSGIAFEFVIIMWDTEGIPVSSFLVFKNESDAKFAAKQFESLYLDLYLINFF